MYSVLPFVFLLRSSSTCNPASTSSWVRPLPSCGGGQSLVSLGMVQRSQVHIDMLIQGRFEKKQLEIRNHRCNCNQKDSKWFRMNYIKIFQYTRTKTCKLCKRNDTCIRFFVHSFINSFIHFISFHFISLHFTSSYSFHSFHFIHFISFHFISFHSFHFIHFIHSFNHSIGQPLKNLPG